MVEPGVCVKSVVEYWQKGVFYLLWWDDGREQPEPELLLIS